MEKQVPHIKIENGELKVEGEFQFVLSPTTINKDFYPVKRVSFDWCVELIQSVSDEFGEDVIIEKLAEKLKQDFIKLNKKS